MMYQFVEFGDRFFLRLLRLNPHLHLLLLPLYPLIGQPIFAVMLSFTGDWAGLWGWITVILFSWWSLWSYFKYRLEDMEEVFQLVWKKGVLEGRYEDDGHYECWRKDLNLIRRE